MCLKINCNSDSFIEVRVDITENHIQLMWLCDKIVFYVLWLVLFFFKAHKECGRHRDHMYLCPSECFFSSSLQTKLITSILLLLTKESRRECDSEAGADSLLSSEGILN